MDNKETDNNRKNWTWTRWKKQQAAWKMLRATGTTRIKAVSSI